MSRPSVRDGTGSGRRVEKQTPSVPVSETQSVAPVSGSGEPIDLNRVSLEALRQLPGIGKALATRIVASRDEQGPFADVWDVLRVPGVSYRVVARLADRLVVDGIPARPRGSSLRPSLGPTGESVAPNGFGSFPAPARISMGPRPTGYKEFLTDKPPSTGPLGSPLPSRRTEAVPEVLSVAPPSLGRSSAKVPAVAKDPPGPSLPIVPEAPSRTNPSPTSEGAPSAAPRASAAQQGASTASHFGRLVGNEAGVGARSIRGSTVRGRGNGRCDVRNPKSGAADPGQREPVLDVDKTKNKSTCLPRSRLSSRAPTPASDELSAASSAHKKDSLETQAAVQRLTQEVGVLRSGQKETDRRISEMRAHVEARLRSGLPVLQMHAQTVEPEPEGWARAR